MARHKEFDQDKAIDKAKELFWLQGYEATSVQDLVDHLDISRSSLYDTFKDKYSLYLCALDRYQQSEYERIAAIFARHGFNKSTVETVLWILAEGVLNDAQHKGCLMVNSAVELAHQNQEIAQRCTANRQQMENLFYQALVNAQEAGELSTKHSPRALARFLFGVAQSLQVTAKTHPERQVLEDIVQVALSVLD